MQYWFPHLPAWIPGIIAMVILGAANLISVKSFGEFEFWFAMIKIVTILLMIIAGSWPYFLRNWESAEKQLAYRIFGQTAVSLQVDGQDFSLHYHLLLLPIKVWSLMGLLLEKRKILKKR